jgi:hypothetical protein
MSTNSPCKSVVVLEGHPFPDCPKDPGLTTIWKPVADDKIVQLGKRRNSDARFKVGDQVAFISIGSPDA